jgi:sucrose-6-phosphate hydrolase SacC (GH32 family)
MALYLDGNRYALLSSQNLKDWTRMSEVEVPGASECPDLFALPLDGDRSKSKWVFWGGNGMYRVGSFDGTRFSADTPALVSNFGNTGYAAQTYFNDPKGRRVQIAWHNNSNFPDAAWNQEMGFPTELRLVSTPRGPRLRIWPVAEIASLREPASVRDSHGFYPVSGGLMDVSVTFAPKSSGSLGILLNGVAVRYDAASQELSCLDKRVKIEPERGSVRLRVLVDRGSLEIYAQDGLVSMQMFTLAFSSERGVRISNPDGWKLSRVDVRPLRSAWNQG